jgi:hypothetical protein
MRTSTSYREVPDRMLEFLPELSLRLEECYSAWSPDQPGPVNVFDEVFDPFLVESLRRDRDPDLLNRAFAFLESLARSTDVDVAGLVSCPTAESLITEPSLLDRALELAGPETGSRIRAVRDWRPPSILDRLRRAVSRRITSP